MRLPISVVILSYNRPKYLEDALTSCKGVEEIIVMDDGSDFEVRHNLWKAWGVNVFLGRKRSPEEHVGDPNFARFLTAATSLVTTPFITFLCDDDQFAPGWLEEACRRLEGHEVVIGDTITSDGSAIHSLAGVNFCLGNFALRTELLKRVGWTSLPTASPEIELLKSLHPTPILRINVPALLARRHTKNLSLHVDGSNDRGEFKMSALDFYKGGWAE